MDAHSRFIKIGQSLGRSLDLPRFSFSVFPSSNPDVLSCVSCFARGDEFGVSVGWVNREQSLDIAVIYGAVSDAWYLGYEEVIPLKDRRCYKLVSASERALIKTLKRRFSLEEATQWLEANLDSLEKIIRSVTK